MLAGTMIGLAVGAVVTGVTVATGGLAAAFGGLILFGAMLAGGGTGWSNRILAGRPSATRRRSMTRRWRASIGPASGSAKARRTGSPR